MEKIHLSNAHKLSALIEKLGFPVLSNAGEQGVRLSWLIIQHAISWPGLPPVSTTPIFATMERPPMDPIKKKKEFEQWLKRVGWRNS
ncbi:MAG: hypothetical protein NDI69_12360 [Bacteriovoracaceae bacterium]|nr:hypothetical protein [Bacteriovoracaceae bacterium]